MHSWVWGLVALAAAVSVAEPARPADGGWQAGTAMSVAGLRVVLSKPLLVGRSGGYLWFPTVVRLASGELLAMMSDYADIHVSEGTSQVAWSADGGLTWSPLSRARGGDGSLTLPNGDTLFMLPVAEPRRDSRRLAPHRRAGQSQRPPARRTDQIAR